MTVPSLIEQLGSPPQRATVVDDALRVLEAEVADKSGLGGIAIKTAFGILKSVRPGILNQLVDKLLDEFLKAVEPFYQRAIAAGKSPGALVEAEKSQVASALLAVTDARAARASGDTLKKTYEKLRPTAQKQVEAATPRIAGLLDRHAKRA